MKPIPNHRGLRYAVATTAPSGKPLKVAFSVVPNGPLDSYLVKPGRVRSLDPETQAESPWYLRFTRPDDGRPSWKRCGSDPSWTTAGIEAALADAVRFLANLPTERSAVEEFLDRTAERARLCVSTVMDEYTDAGCPDRHLQPRQGTQLREHNRILALARRWWGPKPARNITQADMDEYVAWRQADVEARRAAGDLVARGTGVRAAELELAALSSVFHWAARRRRVDANPFATRGTYRVPGTVVNAQVHQPSSDEELHALCVWMIQQGRPVSAARCMFQALTGLRLGEYLLRWDAAAGQPGWICGGLRNGLEVQVLCISREKHGLNPAVAIHPSLEAFITAWRAYAHRHWPTSPWWFPRASSPDQPAHVDDSPRDLLAASRALGLPGRTSHGLRAFYVTVRRSQGVSDAQISEELGHRSGAGLIARVYGQPQQVFGSRTHDWLPNETQPQTLSLLNA